MHQCLRSAELTAAVALDDTNRSTLKHMTWMVRKKVKFSWNGYYTYVRTCSLKLASAAVLCVPVSCRADHEVMVLPVG